MTTAAEALAAATARLRAAGVEGPERDARVLLAHALGIDRARLVLALAEPLPPAADALFQAAVAAREARQPVAQITGTRAFFGLELQVTSDVLDPRPETELLVEQALAEPFERLLDLGTGSGAILLACLAARPAATGLGTDISEAALEVAADNARRLGLDDRAAFLRADWWQGVAGRFDLVVSNPPYIAAEDLAGLAPETRDWEPRGALSPGADALAAYRSIAAGAAAHLAPGGRLMVEVGEGQAGAVRDIFAAAGLTSIAIHPDLDGRDRVVAARAPV